MRFPLFTLIAPAITSLILWAITRSPFSLIFALMGPVAALAQFGDAKIFRRRDERRAEATRQIEAEGLHAQQQLASTEELTRELRRWPPASVWLRPDELQRPTWAHQPRDPQETRREVRIGLDVVTKKPVVIDISPGIAIRGERVLAVATERAIQAQLGWRFGLDELPASSIGPAHTVIVCPADPVPSYVRFLLEVDLSAQAVLTDFGELDDCESSHHIDVDLLSRDQLDALEKKLRTVTPYEQAHSREDVELPQVPVEIGQQARAGSLSVVIGQTPSGSMELDLVIDGPHAVVTGMTGSGKSEFLCSWLLAIATSYEPSEVNFALIDFKGGASFSKVAGVPHLAGIVTDMQADQVERVCTCLSAELIFRENVLSKASVSNISQLPPQTLPRLIVVVDEYRALTQQFPRASEVLADLAARGRSLGVHLILSTQRVPGTVSETLLANVPIRVGFAQVAEGDAHAFFGQRLSHRVSRSPGIGTVVDKSGRPLPFAAAFTTPDSMRQAREIFDSWQPEEQRFTVRPVWVPPLPHAISRDEAVQLLAAGSRERIVSSMFGIQESADFRSHEPAEYHIETHGSLCVTGEAQSGKTSTLWALATSAAAHTHTDVVYINSTEQLWDALVEKTDDYVSAQDNDDARKNRLFVIDDFDVMISELPTEYRDKLMLSVENRIRADRRSALLLSCSSTNPFRHQLSRLTSDCLELTSRSTPGRTSWQGRILQVFLPSSVNLGQEAYPGSRGKIEHRAVSEFLAPNSQKSNTIATVRQVVICTTRLRFVRHQLNQLPGLTYQLVNQGMSVTDLAGAPAVLLCDIEQLAAQNMSWLKTAENVSLAFDQCSLAEVRMLRLTHRQLPYTERDHVIVVHPDGGYERYSWQVRGRPAPRLTR